MKQLNLDIEIRAVLAQRILTTLENAMPGSTAQLRGSLAEGRADPYSDIDIFWEVPDDLFQVSVTCIADILSTVHSLGSIRSSPEFQNSGKRRLIFVQFENMPLFWRLDLDIFALSVHRDLEYDLHNETAKGNDWSLTHSALMNAIAAIKALLRNNETTAKQLISRGFERIGRVTPEGSTQDLILELSRNIAEMDSTKVELTQRIIELHQQVFG
jgi:predicted transcriptional regulator